MNKIGGFSQAQIQSMLNRANIQGAKSNASLFANTTKDKKEVNKEEKDNVRLSEEAKVTHKDLVENAQHTGQAQESGKSGKKQETEEAKNDAIEMNYGNYHAPTSHSDEEDSHVVDTVDKDRADDINILHLKNKDFGVKSHLEEFWSDIPSDIRETAESMVKNNFQSNPSNLVNFKEVNPVTMENRPMLKADIQDIVEDHSPLNIEFSGANIN